MYVEVIKGPYKGISGKVVKESEKYYIIDTLTALYTISKANVKVVKDGNK